MGIYNYTYRVIAAYKDRSKKVIFEGSYRDCVLCMQGTMDLGGLGVYLDMVRSDSLLMIRQVLVNAGFSKPLRHLGQLDTQQYYPFGYLKKLYTFLRENNISFSTVCTASGTEREYCTKEFFLKNEMQRLSIESTGFGTIDDVTDIVLLALPKGVSDDVHSITIRLNDTTSNDSLPINLWSRGRDDGELDIFVAHRLGDISYEL